MKQTIFAALSLCLLVVRSVTAGETPTTLSCPEKPAVEGKARRLAGTLFGEAETAFDNGLYLKSLEQFLCSMVMVEHPNTVINIEKTLTNLKDKATALPLLRDYVAKVPNGELTENLVAIADRIEKEIQQEKAAHTECNCPEPVTVPVTCPEAPTCDKEQRHAERADRILSTTGWADVGVGAAAFVSAIVLQGLAASEKNRAQNADTYDIFLDAEKKNRSFQIAATTMFITSALLAATGLTHLFLLSSSQKKDAVAATPKTGDTPNEDVQLEKPSVSLVPGPTFFGIKGTF
jgi:hypothetical protein